MNKLSWLENLQKGEAPRPLPEPTAKIDEFADLFKIGDVSVEKSNSPFPDGAEDVPSAIDNLLKAEESRKFDIPEIPVGPVHRDGVEIEKSVGGTLHFHWKNNQLIKTELYDGTGRVEVIQEEETEKPLYVSEQVAKILGVADMAEEEPLRK